MNALELGRVVPDEEVAALYCEVVGDVAWGRPA